MAIFWALWEQSNGQTWTLQATSDLMDKNMGFGLTLLPAQIQVVNGLLILIMVPIFTFGVYPLAGRFVKVTPLRKISVGLFLVAASFLIVAWIEGRIQGGHRVSAWWQILAYVVLSASEVLVSITALEFSYKQAPLGMKSFIMSLFLLSFSLGNLVTAAVNNYMVRELPGRERHQRRPDLGDPAGCRCDGDGPEDRLQRQSPVSRCTAVDGKDAPLEGTFLVAEMQGNRVRLMDNEHRQAVATTGSWNTGRAGVSTYTLVGPQYFKFFAYLMTGFGLVFIVVAILYRGQDHVRADAPAAAA